jgi:hypothetical protein
VVELARPSGDAPDERAAAEPEGERRCDHEISVPFVVAAFERMFPEESICHGPGVHAVAFIDQKSPTLKVKAT